MKKVLQDIIFLFLFLQIAHSVNGDCLQNLRIVKNQNDNANSLTLGWEYKCGQCSQCDTEEVNMITFKIYWEHQEWLACDIKKNFKVQIPTGHNK